QEQGLVARRVSRTELDNDGSVTENVMVFAVEEQRPGLFEVPILVRIRSASCAGLRFGEHGVTFDFLDDPRRARDQIGIGNMIAMVMRESQICDVARRIPDLRKLRQQRFRDGESSLRGRAWFFELGVWYFAGIPYHRAAGMRDQVTRSEHLRVC